MTLHHRVQIGDAEIVVLSDGQPAFPGPFLMVGVNEDAQRAACEKWRLDHNSVESNINCVYLNRGGQKILFDTGAGPTLPGCGSIMDALAEAEIDPASIDIVLHTHLHLDHVGGNVTSDGQASFPNARHCVGKSEWEFWSSEETLRSVERAELWKLPDFEPAMAATVRSCVLPIQDRVEVIEDQGEAVPGVSAIPTFGHTPGHLVFNIDLGSENLLITGDLALSPIHLDNANWFPAVDLDPVQAIKSRAAVFNLAVLRGDLVSGYHLPFPGIGRVETAATGWNWLPVM